METVCSTHDRGAAGDETARILERFAAAPRPWLSRLAILGGVGKPSAPARAAFAQLQARGQLLAVGRIGNTSHFALMGSCRSADERLLELACTALLDAVEPGSLTPLSMQVLRSGGKRSLPGVPAAVRDHLPVALQALLEQRRAFMLTVGGSEYFLVRPDLEAVLARPENATAVAPPVAQPEETPAVVSEVAEPACEASADAAKLPASAHIEAAYRRLREETGLRNVSIASLLERSGVELSQLHRYLYARCHDHRANATLGEPTVATEAELSAALIVDGQPHVYIELC